VKPLDLLEARAWVSEVRRFGRAVFVHKRGVFRGIDVCVEGCKVCPSVGIGWEGFVMAEGHVRDEESYAVVIEVHRIDVCRGESAESVNDDIELV
jgi:hypothetical protein